jgi:hypothetical protein
MHQYFIQDMRWSLTNVQTDFRSNKPSGCCYGQRVFDEILAVQVDFRSTRPPCHRNIRILTVLTAILCSSGSAGDFNDRSFLFSHEFYGPHGFTDPAASANLKARMANALTLWPPIDSGVRKFILDRQVGLISSLYGVTFVSGFSSSDIERERQAVAAITNLHASHVIWNPMPEWDQAGGKWVPNGRPRYLGLTKEQAYAKFRDYYFRFCSPLGTYLKQTAAERGCKLAAVTDYPMNTFYAYANGVDVCLLERSIDELSDISTGIAFIRGAARQYERTWGIDVANWRTANGAATQFDSQGVLIGGWSPSYLKRHFYIAYMSGAHILQNEAAKYYFDNGQLNPLGRATREFANFALTRHRDVGRPVVATALMVDFYGGFDAKHWLHNQADAVWYQDIGYSAGDHMIDNFLRVAYPGHWLHGLTPGAPFNDSHAIPDMVLFRQYLATGKDPRPYEPMGTTRWGDNLDIIANNASLGDLQHYRVIALLGAVTIGSQLRAELTTWVKNGGILIMNTAQMTHADESLAGVKLTTGAATGNRSRWSSDATAVREPAFTYSVVVPTSASVLATNGRSDPLVTLNRVGKGTVLVTTPRYLQSDAGDQLLAVGTRLFDEISRKTAKATVVGPPVEYIVNETGSGNLIVTVVNNSPATWGGSIVSTSPVSGFDVREYTTDTAVRASKSGMQLTVTVQVPPYDVRVVAVEVRGTAGARQKAHSAAVHDHRGRLGIREGY